MEYLQAQKQHVQVQLDSIKKLISTITGDNNKDEKTSVEKTVEGIVNDHIKRLHAYNEIKDAAQILLGKIADKVNL